MPRASAPMNAAPAPVVSTASTGAAGMRWMPPSSATRAPSAPRVRTTDAIPCSCRARTIASGSEGAPAPGASWARTSAASCWFTTSGSEARSTARARSITGAGLWRKRPVTRAGSASMPLRGISPWHTTMLAAEMTSPAVRTRSASIAAFAPAMTTIEFSPSSATVTIASPVGPSTSARGERSTPASRSADSATSACASVPTAPTIATRAPRRAAATAWFAPLPPGSICPPVPCRVSPGAGWRRTCARRSTFTEPTTTIEPSGRGVAWWVMAGSLRSDGVVHAGPRRRPDLEPGTRDLAAADVAAAVGPLLEPLLRGVEIDEVLLGAREQRLGAGAVHGGGLPLGVVLVVGGGQLHAVEDRGVVAPQRPDPLVGAGAFGLEQGAEVVGDRSALAAGDVDLPHDAEAVGEGAVDIAPHLLLERHRDLAAHGQLLVCAAQHRLVIAHQGEGDVGAAGVLAHPLDHVGGVQADQVGDLERAVYDLVGCGVALGNGLELPEGGELG